MPPRPRRAVPPVRRAVVATTAGAGVLALVMAASVLGAAAAPQLPDPLPVSTPSPTPSPTPLPVPLPSELTPSLPIEPTPDPIPAPTVSPSPSPSPSPTVAPPADRVDRQWPRNPPWDACPRPVWPGELSTGAPGNGRRVLLIGDSLTRESRVETAKRLRASGWTPTFRCWGSRRLDWGIAQVRRARELGQLPGVVVVALGTNDASWEPLATTQARVRTLMSILGPKRQVLWVNLDVDYSSYSASRALWINEMIQREAAKRDNLTVVPWRRIARAERAGRYDGIHYGSSGYRLRAKVVAEAVDAQARREASAPSPN